MQTCFWLSILQLVITSFSTDFLCIAGEKPTPVVLKDEQAIAAQQQELQQKILNILNGSSSGQGTPPTQSAPSYGVSAPQLGTSVSTAPTSVAPTNINFDNPHVQKALDNLISGGSSLLKNIAAVKNPGAGSLRTGFDQRADQYRNEPYRGGISPHGNGAGGPSQIQTHDPYSSAENDPYGQSRDAYGSSYGSYLDHDSHGRSALPPHGQYGGRY